MIIRAARLYLSLCIAVSAVAQQSTPVPRVTYFSGAVKDAAGAPRTGTVGIAFSLYEEPQGGAALWTEIQNVPLDDQGRYTVLLGPCSRARARRYARAYFAQRSALAGVQVVATQAGNADYSPAAPVNQTFQVAQGNPPLRFGRKRPEGRLGSMKYPGDMDVIRRAFPQSLAHLQGSP